MNDLAGFFRGRRASGPSDSAETERRFASWRLLVAPVVPFAIGINSSLIGQTVKTEPAPASPAAQDAAKPAAKPKSKLHIQNQGYVDHEHQVAISGQVRDEAGNPVAGGRVFN
jgi:hypothetical protein